MDINLEFCRVCNECFVIACYYVQQRFDFDSLSNRVSINEKGWDIGLKFVETNGTWRRTHQA